MTQDIPANIHEAILSVMHAVGYVKKTDSRQLGYSYASEAELIAATRPEMLATGIIMHVVSIDYEREVFVTTNGKNMNMTFAKGIVRFFHVPSKTWIDVCATGEGMDAGDKSANKALTGLYKYAIRQTFMIETGDDPDKDNSKTMERKAKSAAGTELDAAKATLFTAIKAKGGEKNSKLMGILDGELGGHTKNHFASLDTVEKATALFDKVNAIEPVE